MFLMIQHNQMKTFLLPVLLAISVTAHTDDKVQLINASSQPAGNTSLNTAMPLKAVLDDVHRLIENKDYRAAVVELKQLSKLNESNAEVWQLLGVAAHNKGDYLRSKIAFEKALELDPEDAVTVGLQSDLFLSIGDKQSARSNLEKLKRLCPNGCESRERIATALGV